MYHFKCTWSEDDYLYACWIPHLWSCKCNWHAHCTSFRTFCSRFQLAPSSLIYRYHSYVQSTCTRFEISSNPVRNKWRNSEAQWMIWSPRAKDSTCLVIFLNGKSWQLQLQHWWDLRFLRPTQACWVWGRTAYEYTLPPFLFCHLFYHPFCPCLFLFLFLNQACLWWPKCRYQLFSLFDLFRPKLIWIL